MKARSLIALRLTLELDNPFRNTLIIISSIIDFSEVIGVASGRALSLVSTLYIIDVTRL